MNYSEIISLIGTNEYLMRYFKSQLELIRTVDTSMKHIVELERLVSLYGGIHDYYVGRAEEHIHRFCRAVAENTRSNHYRQVDKFDDVYVVLKALGEA